MSGTVPVTEPAHAIFLSYASQDREAAQKICEALRAAGVAVFLDQSELRGGDVWDQKIRREIQRSVTSRTPAQPVKVLMRVTSRFASRWYTRSLDGTPKHGRISHACRPNRATPLLCSTP